MSKTAQTLSHSPVSKEVSDTITRVCNGAVGNAAVAVPFHLDVSYDDAVKKYVAAPAFTKPLSMAQKHAIESNFFRALSNTLLSMQVQQPLDWRYTPTTGKTAMNEKTTTQKLLAVVKKQQAIIEKMAQVLPPQRFEPAHPSKREAETILGALSPQLHSMIQTLEVHLGEGGHGKVVKVMPKAEQAAGAVLQGVQHTVQKLMQANKLIPGASYSVQVV